MMEPDLALLYKGCLICNYYIYILCVMFVRLIIIIMWCNFVIIIITYHPY